MADQEPQQEELVVPAVDPNVGTTTVVYQEGGATTTTTVKRTVKKRVVFQQRIQSEGTVSISSPSGTEHPLFYLGTPDSDENVAGGLEAGPPADDDEPGVIITEEDEEEGGEEREEGEERKKAGGTTTGVYRRSKLCRDLVVPQGPHGGGSLEGSSGRMMIRNPVLGKMIVGPSRSFTFGESRSASQVIDRQVMNRKGGKIILSRSISTRHQQRSSAMFRYAGSLIGFVVYETGVGKAIMD